MANVPLCREHNRLTLRVPDMPASVPGQFLQVKCRDVDDAPIGEVEEIVHEWSPGMRIDVHQGDANRPTPVLRRPFSIAGRRGEEVDLINRDIGPGTHWLSTLRPGDKVDVIGPLGVGFTLPDPGGIALLVGGGVGIPPMIYLAQALAALNDEAADDDRRKAVAFAGAITRDLLSLTITDDAPEPPAGRTSKSMEGLYNIDEFSQFGFPAIISTDDGSYGWHGRVTEPLARYLDAWFDDSWEVGSVRPTIYTCGPEPMMIAVAQVARERGLACQVAVERAMACGMGTCQSCVIRQKDESDRGWSYRLACTHGPVFEASTLLW
ncbi:MAG: dihydroorotate dehydrogenase electron transfer subunit [Planctomycetota bacterium]